jgi:hypothetical protein
MGSRPRRRGCASGPGQQLAGQGGDLAPQLVLGEVLEGKVGAADPVLAGAAAVPQVQVGELGRAWYRWRRR